LRAGGRARTGSAERDCGKDGTGRLSRARRRSRQTDYFAKRLSAPCFACSSSFATAFCFSPFSRSTSSSRIACERRLRSRRARSRVHRSPSPHFCARSARRRGPSVVANRWPHQTDRDPSGTRRAHAMPWRGAIGWAAGRGAAAPRLFLLLDDREVLLVDPLRDLVLPCRRSQPAAAPSIRWISASRYERYHASASSSSSCPSPPPPRRACHESARAPPLHCERA